MPGPVLLELDDATIERWRQRVRPWLATTAMLQQAYRRMLEDTVPGIEESHWRAYLGNVLESAREHEGRLADIHAAFGVEPAGPGVVRDAASLVRSKSRQALGQLEGLAGGVRGGTVRKLRELLLANLDAIGGYGVTEQLGLALARPAVTNLTVPILIAKGEHQLQLQECFLEMAANAILRQQDV